MVQDSIANYSSFLKAQMQIQEQLLEYLFKMEAQMEVILKTDLNDYATVHLYNYLRVIHDLVLHAEDLSQQLLNSSIRSVS